MSVLAADTASPHAGGPDDRARVTRLLARRGLALDVPADVASRRRRPALFAITCCMPSGRACASAQRESAWTADHPTCDAQAGRSAVCALEGESANAHPHAQSFVVALLLVTSASPGRRHAGAEMPVGEEQGRGQVRRLPAECRREAGRDRRRCRRSTVARSASCETKFASTWQKLIDKATAAGATCPDAPLTGPQFKTVIDEHSDNITHRARRWRSRRLPERAVTVPGRSRRVSGEHASGGAAAEDGADRLLRR